jgi:hypothetical protein
MKPSTWMILILSILLGGSVLILIYLDMFSNSTFVGTLILILDYVVVYLYLLLTKKEEDKLNEEKDKFPYCWKHANDMLKNQMPGGDSLEWWSGSGRQSQTRTFYDGNQRRRFRAMYGYLTRMRQGVIVIWDIDKEDIAAYWTNPSMEKLQDPFKGFDPFHKDDQLGKQMMRMMGRKKGRGMRGMSMSFGDGPEAIDYEPDDDFVKRASDPDGEERG